MDRFEILVVGAEKPRPQYLRRFARSVAGGLIDIAVVAVTGLAITIATLAVFHFIAA